MPTLWCIAGSMFRECMGREIGSTDWYVITQKFFLLEETVNHEFDWLIDSKSSTPVLSDLLRGWGWDPNESIINNLGR